MTSANDICSREHCGHPRSDHYDMGPDRSGCNAITDNGWQWHGCHCARFWLASSADADPTPSPAELAQIDLELAIRQRASGDSLYAIATSIGRSKEWLRERGIR